VDLDRDQAVGNLLTRPPSEWHEVKTAEVLADVDTTYSMEAVDDDHEEGGLEMRRVGTEKASDDAPETTRLLELATAPRDYSGAEDTFRNFVLFSVLFSAVPASALACLSLATARLGSVGAWQSGILYLTYTLSAVMGATYVSKKLGSRNAMISGMTLFCLYVLCFLLATLQPKIARPLALTGAGLGGIGAGIQWTAQGVYFSQAAEEYSLFSGRDWAESTSMMAGIFASILLAEETALDVLSTVLIRMWGIPWSIIFALYGTIAVSGTMAMTLVKKYPSQDDGDAALSSAFHKILAAFRLLIVDSKMKYMIGLNAAFGFAGAFLNSFVSGEVVPVALADASSSYVGLLVAIHGGVAAAMSLIFGQFSQKFGKGPVLVIGALCFGSVAFPFLVQPDLEHWDWGMLIIVYALQGMGRATFEGTLKGIFADYFPYEKDGAFANIILQNGLSSAMAYILSFRLTCSRPSTYCIEYRDGSLHDIFTFGMLVVLTSILAIPGYLRASYLFNTGEGSDELSQYRRQSIASYRSSLAPSETFLDR